MHDPFALSLAFREYPLRLATDFETFARPSIHLQMLADAPRMDAFRAAIGRVVKPGAMVADIGTGTGILTHWALEAGAKNVWAIEAGSLAPLARRMLDDTGYGERVTLLAQTSFDVELPLAVDVIITETLGHIGIDEGILAVAADARRRFARSDAAILPRRLRVKATPVNSPAFHEGVLGYWRSRPFAYDTSAIAPLVGGTPYLTAAHLHEALAEPAVLAEFVLGEEAPPVVTAEVAVPVARVPSTLGGFLITFDCELAEDLWLDSADTRHWGPMFLPTQTPLPVRAGNRARLWLEVGEAARWQISVG